MPQILLLLLFALPYPMDRFFHYGLLHHPQEPCVRHYPTTTSLSTYTLPGLQSSQLFQRVEAFMLVSNTPQGGVEGYALHVRLIHVFHYFSFLVLLSNLSHSSTSPSTILKTGLASTLHGSIPLILSNQSLSRFSSFFSR